MKNLTKAFLLMLSVVMLVSVMAFGASAAEIETVEIQHKDGDEFEATYLLAQAALEEGKNAHITLNANVAFAKNATFGESNADGHTGVISISSALDAETGAPLYGFTVTSTVVVNFYGNFTFDNIKFENVKGSSQSWSSGGCFQFTEGVGVFGKNGAVVTVGGTSTSNPCNGKPHLAGKVEVYSGIYWSISGNFYNSGVVVNNPSVKFAGTARAEYVFAGSHNQKNNNVTGATTLYIGGSAVVDKAAVGSWFAAANQIGGTGLVEGTANINTISAGGAGTGAVNEGKQYVLDVKGGTIGTVGAWICTAASSNITTNTVININADAPNLVYGGWVSSFSSESGKKDYSATGSRTVFQGKTEINVNVDLTGSVYGGSHIIAAHSDHIAETTVNVNGVAIKGEFFGGSDMPASKFTWKNTAANTSTVINTEDVRHTGKLTLNFKNGASVCAIDAAKGNALYVGSKIYAPKSYHAGEIVVNTFVDAGNSAAYSLRLTDSMWCGSRLSGTESYHSGKVTANLDKISVDLKTQSWAAIAGGSYAPGSKADHKGEANVTITNITNTSKGFCGGSYLDNGTAKHSGNSTLTLVNVSKSSGHAIGGSVLGKTGAEHSGNCTLVLKEGGTYAISLYGGSYFNQPGVVHSGTSTLEVWGSTVKNSDGTYARPYVFNNTNTNSNSNLYGASNPNGKGNSVQSGDSYLYLRDLLNDNGSNADNWSIDGRIHGGTVASYISDGSIFEMKGNTTIVVRRCELSNAIYGGSYLDGNNIQSGDSKIILEGNIQLNADGTESVGVGYNIIRSQIRGGSNIGAYVSSTVPYGSANHTGKTGVDIIAGTYPSNATIYQKTVLYNRVYGGNDYNARTPLQQTSDSTITFVKGTVNYGGNPEIIPGPIYNGQTTVRTSTATADNLPTFSTVINNGAYVGCAIFAGGYIDCKTNTTYYNNSAIIIDGGFAGNLTANHKLADASRVATLAGDSYIELGANAYVSGTTTAKITGLPTGITRAEGYKSYIKFLDPMSNLTKMTFASFDVLDLYRFKGDTATTKAAVSATETYEPFANGVAVTLSNKTVENGTVLADFVKGQTVTIGAKTYSYDELVKFDYISNYDNAFDFYTKSFGAEQKVEKIDVINKIIVGEGNDRSAEITLTNSSRDTGIHGHVLGTSLTLSDSIAVNMGVKDTLFTAYSNIRVKAIFNGEAKEYDAPTRDALYSYENIGPHMMNDAVYFMIYATNADGEEVCSGILNQTIKKFCTNKLATSEDVFKKVCMDLLNYGAAAQVYANYQTDTPANTGVDAYKQYATAEMAAVSNKSKIEKIDNATVALQAPNLYLDKNVEIRYTYKPTEEKLEELVAKVVLGNGTEFTLDIVNNADNFIVYEEGGFVLRINQLNPSQMRETVTVSFWKGETQVSHAVTYSIESYVASKLSQTSALKDMIVEMMKYGDAVKAWQDAANA